MTRAEAQMLYEALDSHEYWQLSEAVFRRDGFVLDDGHTDPEKREEISKCRALMEKFRLLLDR